MAIADSITIDINVNVSRETLNKCANIINMADKPDCSGDLVAVIDQGKCLGYYVLDEAHSSPSKITLLRVGNFPYECDD